MRTAAIFTLSSSEDTVKKNSSAFPPLICISLTTLKVKKISPGKTTHFSQPICYYFNSITKQRDCKKEASFERSSLLCHSTLAPLSLTLFLILSPSHFLFVSPLAAEVWNGSFLISVHLVAKGTRRVIWVRFGAKMVLEWRLILLPTAVRGNITIWMRFMKLSQCSAEGTTQHRRQKRRTSATAQANLKTSDTGHMIQYITWPWCTRCLRGVRLESGAWLFGHGSKLLSRTPSINHRHSWVRLRIHAGLLSVHG